MLVAQSILPSLCTATALLKPAPALLQASSRHCCSRHFLVPFLDATLPQAQSPPGAFKP